MSRHDIRVCDSSVVCSAKSCARQFEDIDDLIDCSVVRHGGEPGVFAGVVSASLGQSDDDTPEGTLSDNSRSRPVGDDSENDVADASVACLDDQRFDSRLMAVESVGDNGLCECRMG